MFKFHLHYNEQYLISHAQPLGWDPFFWCKKSIQVLLRWQMCDFRAQLHTASAVSLLSTDDIMEGTNLGLMNMPEARCSPQISCLVKEQFQPFFLLKSHWKLWFSFFIFLQMQSWDFQNKPQTNLGCSSEGVVLMPNANAINSFKLPKLRPLQ